MHITKYLHSCLLVEENDTSILIDPGIFTYQEKALEINHVAKLDYIAITHEHPDHCHTPLIKELVKKFPDVTIISNKSVVELLIEEGIKATIEGSEHIKLSPLAHEELWDTKAPDNVLLTVFDKFTHPGDSHHFETTNEILALPIQAPWGSTYAAVQLALRLQPKVILPIHDYMLKDEMRKAMYQRLQTFFEKMGIDFKALETGERIEIHG